MEYTRWINDKFFYQKLIEDASVEGTTVKPIDHSTQPKEMSVDEIVRYLEEPFRVWVQIF